jgi:hypothetical protein
MTFQEAQIAKLKRQNNAMVLALEKITSEHVGSWDTPVAARMQAIANEGLDSYDEAEAEDSRKEAV